MEGQKPATKKEVEILILGDSSVGKSSLLRRFVKNKFHEGRSQSTCGLDNEVKSIQINGQDIKLVIWDSAGQEKHLRSLPSSYFKRVQGVLLVYSVDERESFEKIQDWMSQADEKAPKNVIKILVASKIDSENVEVPKNEGAEFARNCVIKFAETSSKDGTGVDRPFYLIAEEFIEQLKSESTAAVSTGKGLLNPLEMSDSELTALIQKSQQSQQSRCCCL